MKKLPTFLACLFLLSPNVVLGSEDVFLVCEYHSTVDRKGNSSSTSGSDTFQISYIEGTDEKNITIKKSGLGALFSGSQSKNEINAETIYTLQGWEKPIRQRLVIDRYSGNIELTFEVGPKFSGIMHFGQCKNKKKLL